MADHVLSRRAGSRTPRSEGRPFRLAVVGPFPPHRDGDAHYTGRLITALAREHRSEVQVRVWTHLHPERDGEEALEPNLTVCYRTGGAGNRWTRARQTLALEPEIEAWRPDCVHFQAVSKPAYGGLMAGVPATALMEILETGGIPTVNTVHNFAPRSELEKLAREKRLPRWLVVTYAHRAYRRMAWTSSVLRILACGDAPQTPEDAIRKIGLTPRRWEPEWHPCDYAPVSAAEREQAKSELGLAGRRVLVAMGFVDRVKGYHNVLAVADRLSAAYPDAKVIIAGDALRPEAEAYARELKAMHGKLERPEAVDLRIGFVPADEWARTFCAADVVIAAYSSTWGPSGPVHHALGRAKPVVVSNVPNNKDLAGIARVVEKDDANSLFEGLSELLASDEDRETLGLAAGEYASRNTWEIAARQLLATCRRAAGWSG